jgi:uncharacterized SAM-binding protein YcdF (DUF218 family)
MVQTTKLFLVPGSLQFFGLGLLLGVALLYGNARWQRWGRAWLIVLALAYGALSTPVGSDLLASPLTRQYGSLTAPGQAPGIDTIVTLTTGTFVYRADGLEVVEMGVATAHNALETARVYRLLGAHTVLATGGIVVPGHQRTPEAAALGDGLVRLGIPRDRIVLETQSRTTREQAVKSAAILRQRATRRFVLITDSEHMPRAMAAFRGEGLDPVPSVATLATTTPPGLIYRLQPNLDAYLQSDRACYEYLARVYYWAQDWLHRR